jgi:hypothetical protein
LIKKNASRAPPEKRQFRMAPLPHLVVFAKWIKFQAMAPVFARRGLTLTALDAQLVH